MTAMRVRFIHLIVLLCVATVIPQLDGALAQDVPTSLTPLQLFDEAAFQLALYAGPSAVRPRELIPEARQGLEARCGSVQGCSEQDAIDAIEAITFALADGHTGLISAPEFAQLKLELGGGAQVESFGVLLAPPERALGLVVLDVLPDGPGDHAGLRRGDRILRIDDAYLPSERGERVAAWLRAEMKGEATVSFIRKGHPPMVAQLSAAPILVDRPPTLTMLDGSTAWLRIPSFVPDGVAQQVHDRILDAQRAGATSILVDLRDNPGGLITECVAAAGAFTGPYTSVVRGALLQQSLRWEAGRITFIDRAGREFPQPALERTARWTGSTAVLVNQWSASCAEQMAYALQRYANLPVIGEETLGVLDSSTAFFALSNGMGIAVSMSVIADAEGNKLPFRVEPDVEVADDLLSLSEGTDVVLEQARGSIESQ